MIFMFQIFIEKVQHEDHPEVNHHEAHVQEKYPQQNLGEESSSRLLFCLAQRSGILSPRDFAA